MWSTAARRGLRAAVITGAALAALAPATAEAAFVQVNGNAIQYTAHPGETNQLRIEGNATLVRFTDGTSVTVSAGPGCAQEARNRVRCARTPSSFAQVDLADGADFFDVHTDLPMRVLGGAGNDLYLAGRSSTRTAVEFHGGPGFDTAAWTFSNAAVNVKKDGAALDGRPNDSDNIQRDVERLEGSPFSDTLFGDLSGTGPQEFAGRAGNDLMVGGAGNDLFQMDIVADGADQILGRNGRDTVRYDGRRTPLNITVDAGGANDGEAGERDEIREIEVVFGGEGGDTIIASPVIPASELHGNGGPDGLTGGPGPDILRGGPGNDLLRGLTGIDSLIDQDGAQDRMECGDPSGDTAIADPVDIVSACERVFGVGTLSVTRSLAAKPGKVANLAVAWEHPVAWRQLRSLEVRVRAGKRIVGKFTILPHKRTVRAAAGEVRLVRDARLRVAGKKVATRLAVQIPPSLAGRLLDVDVQGTDIKGTKQLEPSAGLIRVGR